MVLDVVVAVVEAKTVVRIAQNLPDCTTRLGKRPTLCDTVLRVDQIDSLESSKSAIVLERKGWIVCGLTVRRNLERPVSRLFAITVSWS